MKYLAVFTNWRIITLTVMFMAAALLLLAESESIGDTVCTKAAGIALGCLGNRLGKTWEQKGLIDEINAFDGIE